MEYQVPVLSIIFMAIVVVSGIALTLFLFFLFRKKYKADILPFFIGCAVFVVFALLIEGTINHFILTSSLGTKIQANFWLYGIFGGLMAGLFEETGRFTAFKTVLKKKLSRNENALMYGAGHGGIEALFILSLSMINNLVVSVMLNNGNAAALTANITNQSQLDTMNATFSALASTPSFTFLLSIVERIPAVAMHIAWSVLVWQAAKYSKRLWLYPLAIAMHAFIDAISVILHQFGVSIGLILFGIYVFAGISVAFTVYIWKKDVPAVKSEEVILPSIPKN